MNPIPHAHLPIWLCETAKLSDAFLRDAPHRFLNGQEQIRFERFKFPQHQTAFLASRILLKTALQFYLGPNTDVQFNFNAFGKPELVAAINPYGLHFNLSHSAEFTVLAVHQHPVGIDTENLDRKTDILNIARHNFHAREIAQLTTADDAALGFYFWMLKEAYIKLIGKGLSQKLSEFYFDLNGKELAFGFDLQPSVNTGAALVKIGNRCISAICHNPEAVHFNAIELIDNAQVQPVNIEILAQTLNQR